MARQASGDPYAGSTVGPLDIAEQIGAGGMGLVYRGHHRELDREVAVKLMPPGNRKDAEYRKRFLREARAAARIQHRNVVQVIDAGEDDTTAWIALEYVNGPSLGQLLDEQRALPLERALQLAAGIAEGLRAIHQHGVIHRDIKPDNILLAGGDVPKITDLGLAREVDVDVSRLTATGVIVGTPLYVSPEAIRDTRTADTPADIYSFSATLYHMLLGRPPFHGTKPYDVMKDHLEREVTGLREIDPSIPRPVAQLVEQGLAKEPAERPDITTIIGMISECRERLVRGDRKPIMSILAVLVLIAALGLAGWWYMDRRTRNAPQPTTLHIASLSCDLPPGDWEFQINRGNWRAWTGEPIGLEPGAHIVRVRGYREGQLLTAESKAAFSAGELTHVSLAPAVVEVPRAEVRLQGQGLVYLNGDTIGNADTISFTHAGRYQVQRWDGYTCWPHTIVVDEHGAKLVATTITAAPAGPAYLKEVEHLPPHHRLSWQEAEYSRRNRAIEAPAGWQSQAPLAPVQGLSPAMVAAIASHRAEHDLRLPDRPEARALSEHYGAACWFRCDARPELGPGQGETLILLRK